KVIYEEEPAGEDDHAFMEENQDYANFILSLESSKLTVFGKKSSKAVSVKSARPTSTVDPLVSSVSPPTIPPRDLGVDSKRRNASTAGWTKDEVGPERLPIKTKDGLLKPNKRMLPKLVPQGGLVKESLPDGRETGNGIPTPGVGEKTSGKRDISSDPLVSGSEMPYNSGSDEDMVDSMDPASIVGSQEDIKRVETVRSNSGPGELNLNALMQRRFLQKKMLIAELCEAILESPEESLRCPKVAKGEESVSRIEELHDLTEDNDPRVCHLALLSQYAIFKDIIPSYRIRIPTAVEQTQKVSKEVQRMRGHEAALLKAYQAHLKALEAAVQLATASPRGRYAGGGSGPSAGMSSVRARAMAVAAIRCMCGLLSAHPHFNFRTNLVRAVVSGTNSQQEEIREACCDCLGHVFTSDLQGDLSLEVVKAVSKFVKERKFKVSDSTLRCLVGLPLRVREDERARAKARVKSKNRKRKREGGVDAGLMEADAGVDEDLQAKCQADALHEVMLTYFRVLKRRPPPPTLFPAAMEGLAKYIHLVNLDTVQDLLDLLKDLLNNEEEAAKLPLRAALHCILSAFRALQGPGRELQTDEAAFVRALYHRMPDILHELPGEATSGKGQGISSVVLVCDCIDAALIKRRELSTARIAAVTKRLLSMALHLPQVWAATPGSWPGPAAALLRTAHRLLLRYPAAQQLLENEHDRPGSGPYRPDLADPEHANALSSATWELSLLRASAWPLSGSWAGDLVSLTSKDAAAVLVAMHDRERETREMALLSPLRGAFAGVPKPEARAIA
ncbi:unnamed protein product, partial [Choristocarpus tenellus]